MLLAQLTSIINPNAPSEAIQMFAHRLSKHLLIASAFALGLYHAPAFGDLIDPLDPNLAPFTIQVGDFQTVSLNQAQVFEPFFGVAKGTYEVQSSPGQLG